MVLITWTHHDRIAKVFPGQSLHCWWHCCTEHICCPIYLFLVQLLQYQYPNISNLVISTNLNLSMKHEWQSSYMPQNNLETAEYLHEPSCLKEARVRHQKVAKNDTWDKRRTGLLHLRFQVSNCWMAWHQELPSPGNRTKYAICISSVGSWSCVCLPTLSQGKTPRHPHQQLWIITFQVFWFKHLH